MSIAFGQGAYIVATVLFILSLGGLSGQESAKRAVWYGISGMAVAAVATILDPQVLLETTAWIILAAMLAAAREVLVGRELTKQFERLSRGPLGSLAPQFGEAEKGEAVILVAGAADVAPDPDAWRAALAEAMADQPLRAAVDEIAARYGLKRKDVYDAALALKAAQ